MKNWNDVKNKLVVLSSIIITSIIIISLIVTNSYSLNDRSLTNNKIYPTANKGKKSTNISQSIVGNTIENKVYELNATERTKWGIYNDNSHPIETTNGFNNALKWAHDNGYNVFHVPGGLYQIAAGVKDRDVNAQINMVSDMTFLMDNDTVLQKETNKWEQYAIISLNKEAKNITIKGGTLKGDRSTHDYSYIGPSTSGTHEWGFGIITEGAVNINIDSITFQDFTGDGIQAGGTTVRGDKIGPSNVEIGGLDDNGNPIIQSGKIRTNQQSINIYTFNNPVYQNPHYRNVMMWTPKGVTGNYDLYYYKNDGTLIRIDKDQRFNSTFGYSLIPDGAAYWRAVFNATSTSNVGVQMMTVAITENITIQNCNIGNSRRQGISLVGTDGATIINNKIHDIQGTAPQSGIDMEPGFFPALNTLISGNEFKNNKIHLVLAYGGNVTVNNNYFGPGAAFSAKNSGGTLASNNIFDHSSFVGYENVNFKNNRLISTEAKFNGGSNINVEGITGIDSIINITQKIDNGIQVSNISLTSSGQDSKQYGLLLFGDKPLQLNSVYLQGQNSISGTGNQFNIYNNITFNNTTNSTLAAGTYNNLFITGSKFSFTPGKTNINQGHFRNSILEVYNVNSDVTIQDSLFEFNSIAQGNVILAKEAKNISILNNKIYDNATINTNKPMIQIGRDAWKNNPTRVYGATIKGNVLTSITRRIGIDTINGGVGAPIYDVQNNTLNNSTLSLTSKDININNKVFPNL